VTDKREFQDCGGDPRSPLGQRGTEREKTVRKTRRGAKGKTKIATNNHGTENSYEAAPQKRVGGKEEGEARREKRKGGLGGRNRFGGVCGRRS